LQIAMSYKVWDSCVIIIMKLVIWAQEEVHSLHLLFLNSKFMLSWRLHPTSLSPCLCWILKVFWVFCLAFVVASYNLGACNCHDYACNRVCAWFFIYFLCVLFLSISHHMSHLCGSLFLGNLFFHMLQHLAIVLQL
jgi:hypothetical protein